MAAWREREKERSLPVYPSILQALCLEPDRRFAGMTIGRRSTGRLVARLLPDKGVYTLRKFCQASRLRER